MTTPKIYAVHDQSGSFLCKVAATPSQLDFVLRESFPGYRYKASVNKVVVYLPKQLNTEQIGKIAEKGTIPICGEQWQLIHVGGPSSTRRSKVVMVEAAPTARWTPGTPISDAVYKKWEKDTDTYVNEEMLIRLNRDVAYIFGDFRDDHVAVINRVVKRYREGGINVESPSFKKFVEQAVALKYQEYAELDRRKTTVQGEIDNARRSLTDLYRKLDGIEDLLKNEPTPIDVETVLGNVKNLPKVQSLEVDGTNLVVHTEDVYIRSGGKRYHIGKFKILVDILSGGIKFHNKTNQVEGYHHPHVTGASTCFGEIATTVPKLVSSFMIVELTAILIRFLESVNESDCYLTVKSWPEATEAVES